MTNEQNIDFVLRTVEERDIRFIRLWFTDILGNLKSFSIAPEDLEEAFEEGIGFDGSSVEGFAPYEETDMLAYPDASTFQILPWYDEKARAARVFCNISTPSGQPFLSDPRRCLQKMVEKADKQGFIMNVGPELEYFYFADNRRPVVVDEAGYFDLTPFDSSKDLRRDTVSVLERMSIPVEYSYHAMAPSQNGLSLRYADAMSCADNVMTSRLVIKQLAFEQDMFASFMPKPLANAAGSAFFICESLFDHEGNNLFFSEETGEDGLHLSDIARHYIAGLLKYAPEYTLVTNPTVNSYKRLVPNGEVPRFTTWGRRNRAALVRVPTYKPNKQLSTRVELRSPDPACNPYLAIAVTLAAGLKGIEDKLELPGEFTPQDIQKGESYLISQHIAHLPRHLGEAIELFKDSELMHEVLGEPIFNYLIHTKTDEWSEYCATVTDWECDRYYAGF